MDREIYLSVVIPAYNEEELIKDTLNSVECFLSCQKYNYEIIVVDDGSQDSTFSAVKDLVPSFGNLKIIRNGRNRGKGYSVSRGMLFSKGKFRIFMDADNSTSIDQITNLFPFLENGYDVVIGDRTLKESRIKKHQPLHKELLGNIGNKLIRFLAVPEIGDTQCGFKLFSAEAAEDIFSKLTIDRWGFDIEVLAIAKSLGYKIKTVPVAWSNREKTNVRLRDYILTFLELLKIKMNSIRKKYGN